MSHNNEPEPMPDAAGHIYGDLGLIPADVWLWQAPGQWVATNHREIATWWDGADDVVEERPHRWSFPIETDPRVEADGPLVYGAFDARSAGDEKDFAEALAWWGVTAEEDRKLRDVALDSSGPVTSHAEYQAMCVLHLRELQELMSKQSADRVRLALHLRKRAEAEGPL